MKVDLILATRPQDIVPTSNTHGIATVLVEVPVYLWTEILTHRRMCRNASSSRAQSPGRHQSLGYYTPAVFYQQGNFMQAGEPFPEDIQGELLEFWGELHETIYERVREKTAALKARGYTWAKEQVNRLLPTTKMIRGVLTANEDAWKHFLSLRAHPTADAAMQYVAYEIQELLATAVWERSNYHIPFDPVPGLVANDRDYLARAPLAAARLARVSTGAPGPGQRSDQELAADLQKNKHLSPFEHVAQWVVYPRTSALAGGDRADYYMDDFGVWGWQHYRAVLEMEAEQ